MAFNLDRMKSMFPEQKLATEQSTDNEQKAAMQLPTNHGDSGVQFGVLGRSGVGHVGKSRFLGR
jgi:hypothetical protein